jgi:putative hemolysin
MDELGQIPQAGDQFSWREWKFEVMDMDGRRVDKVLVMGPPVQADVQQIKGE